MPFIPLQPPAGLDVDGLRKHDEENFREVARAWTETDRLIAANTAAIAKSGSVLVASPAVTGSSLTIFTGFDPTKYSKVRIDLSDIRSTSAGATLYMQQSVDGSTMSVAASYYGALWAVNHGGVSGSHAWAVQPQHNVAFNIRNASVGDGVTGSMLIDLASGSINSSVYYCTAANQLTSIVGGMGFFNPCLGVAFILSAGTFSAGTIKVYGIIK